MEVTVVIRVGNTAWQNPLTVQHFLETHTGDSIAMTTLHALVMKLRTSYELMYFARLVHKRPRARTMKFTELLFFWKKDS